LSARCGDMKDLARGDAVLLLAQIGACRPAFLARSARQSSAYA
jgi:hypothetical protein